MLTVRIIGYATSTVKHPSLNGCKLLIAQTVGSDGVTPEGDVHLVVDRDIGAGIGDKCFVVNDGGWNAQLLNNRYTPARNVVMGIVDE